MENEINNVKALIDKKGLKAKDIAAAVGKTPNWLMKINSGETALTQATLLKLSRAINCFPSELLPISWQKPGQVDEEILMESVKKGLLLYKHGDGRFTELQIIHAIIQEYKESINKTFSES